MSICHENSVDTSPLLIYVLPCTLKMKRFIKISKGPIDV